MKKIILVLAVLVLAAPVLADTVTITAVPQFRSSQDQPCVVDINYVVSDANLVRGFAFDITVTDGNIVSISDYFAGDCNSVNRGYGIFPGNFKRYINPADPNWADPNYTPVAELGDLPGDTQPGLGHAGITVELGSLYEDANTPATSGTLCKVTVNNIGDTCTLSVETNESRGGVVMEDTGITPTVVLTGATDLNIGEGIKSTAPEYSDWVALSKPDCWCYPFQCRGDGNGLKPGPFQVDLTDLNLLRAAFNKFDHELPTDGECSDYSHSKPGPFRVDLSDLNILRVYFNEFTVPECPTDNRHFWITP